MKQFKDENRIVLMVNGIKWFPLIGRVWPGIQITFKIKAFSTNVTVVEGTTTIALEHFKPV